MGVSNMFIQAVLRYAPPPALITMPATGIDISEQGIRYIFFEHTHGRRSIGFYGSHEISEGTIHRGRIQNPDGLLSPLRKIAQEHTVAFARISLPEHQSYLFSTSVPRSAREEEVRRIIAHTLEEHVPLSSQEALFDHYPTRSSGTETQVMVSVFPRKLVEQYVSIFSEAGIIPLSIEGKSHAFARAAMPHTEAGTYLILCVEEEHTDAAIVQTGTLRHTRSLDIGCTQLEHEEAAKDEFARKVDDVLDTWNEKRESGGALVEMVYVTGMGASQAVRSLNKNNEVSVKQADVWKNVFSPETYVPDIPEREAPTYAAAIGLALRETGIE